MKETDTPRTDAYYKSWEESWSSAPITLDLCRELERELTTVTEQRDRLAEALRKFVGDALFCSHADTTTTVLPHRQADDSGDALTMP